jgi:hypothetical protein
VVVIKQVDVSVFVTATRKILLWVAAETLRTERLVEATNLPVSSAEVQGDGGAGINTGGVALRLSSTTTLVNLTFPMLVTVPP